MLHSAGTRSLVSLVSSEFAPARGEFSGQPRHRSEGQFEKARLHRGTAGFNLTREASLKKGSFSYQTSRTTLDLRRPPRLEVFKSRLLQKGDRIQAWWTVATWIHAYTGGSSSESRATARRTRGVPWLSRGGSSTGTGRLVPSSP